MNCERSHCSASLENVVVYCQSGERLSSLLKDVAKMWSSARETQRRTTSLSIPLPSKPKAQINMPFQSFDYANYIKQNPLSANSRFLPLFEAIENAFNAIEERYRLTGKESGGLVTITIVREAVQPVLKLEETKISPPPIIGFQIKDNGIGFREANWRAFKEVYTTHKLSFGGKGVGRLTYLLAFQEASVESYFAEGDKKYARSFSIEPTRSGPTESLLKEVESTDEFTIVSLNQMRPMLREKCPKNISAVANQIALHFFKRLSISGGIRCELHDAFDGQIIDLHTFFREEMLLSDKRSRFTLRNEEFVVTQTKCKTKAANRHQIMLCANGRVVSTHAVPAGFIQSKAKLDDGNDQFFYVALVESQLLDSNCSNDRTRFLLDEEDDDVNSPSLLESSTPSISSILTEVGKLCKKFLRKEVAPLEVIHQRRIEELCRSNMNFKPLLKQKQKELFELPYDLSDSELEKSVWRIYSQWKYEIRTRFSSMTKSVRDNNNKWMEYRDRYRSTLHELSQMAMHDLAVYVTDRRAVLDFLWDRLKATEDGKFRDEAAIHDIFFPRNTDSNDIAWDESNLWIIDERLLFQQYTASDLNWKKVGLDGVDSNDRPDVCSSYDRVFDDTFAFTEGSQPYSSATLVEFKRPERESYTELENPYAQVVRYINQIRKAGSITKDGHTFRMDKSQPIHAYVVCHLVEKLLEHLNAVDFTESADGQGFVVHLPKLNAIIYFATFEKLIADARKRNRAFFDKLGLE
ncbi:hypothetical protein VN12_26690 [Pirellula sp. SH-Sr6A]|nr:hypothetical protein VN12_26690 [Pirellula sp. SH-Sr6A]